MALINPNQYIKQLRDFGDRVADGITAFAGNIVFVYFHILWFSAWLMAGTGAFGPQYEVDKFPFSLLTLVVSLEAIFLSTFVMISQNRAAEKSEIRSQLDYETDLQAEREIAIIMRTLALKVRPQDLTLLALTDDPNPQAGTHHLHITFKVNIGSQEPVNAEPDECDRIAWFPLDQLPEPLFPPHTKIFATIKSGRTYRTQP
jgi:uncharacterized membrane protein